MEIKQNSSSIMQMSTKFTKLVNLEHESIENSKIYQGVNAFKKTLLNGDKLNFIFIDKEEYLSLFSFLDTFDFSVSKILIIIIMI